MEGGYFPIEGNIVDTRSFDYPEYGGVMGMLQWDVLEGFSDKQSSALVALGDSLLGIFTPYEVAIMPWSAEQRVYLYFWNDIPTDYMVGNILYQFVDMGAYSTYFLTTGCPGEFGCGGTDPRDLLREIGLLPAGGY